MREHAPFTRLGTIEIFHVLNENVFLLFIFQVLPNAQSIRRQAFLLDNSHKSFDHLKITWVMQNQCVNKEQSHYSGTVNGTIHIVVGGGGSRLAEFGPVQPPWSVYRDSDYGFVKLTAFNHSSLLYEYKKSNDGKVYDSFTISRDYRDVLACVHDGCEPTTLAP